MNFIGNILWLILGGLITALIYFVGGILFCISIIGIPFGCQLFKIGTLCLWPFGREVSYGPNANGCLSLVMNVLWFLVGGWEVAVAHIGFGLLCCITIIGIPFGLQHFKLAMIAVFPFGKSFA